jgi:hypothetical protein
MAGVRSGKRLSRSTADGGAMAVASTAAIADFSAAGSLSLRAHARISRISVNVNTKLAVER